MAFNQRNDTVKALGPQRTSVVLFIDDVNRELDRLEGDLKKLFPWVLPKSLLAQPMRASCT